MRPVEAAVDQAGQVAQASRVCFSSINEESSPDLWLLEWEPPLLIDELIGLWSMRRVVSFLGNIEVLFRFIEVGQHCNLKLECAGKVHLNFIVLFVLARKRAFEVIHGCFEMRESSTIHHVPVTG